MKIELQWLHFGNLMNFSQCILLNGKRVSEGMLPEDARKWARKLAKALDYTDPIRAVNKWTAPQP